MLKYSILSSDKTPQMANLYKNILNNKFNMTQLNGNKMWTDYNILIDLKAIPLNFGKYTLFKSPYKDKIQNDKNAYIGSTPIDKILGYKHILDYNTFDFYPKSFVFPFVKEQKIDNMLEFDYFIIKPSSGSEGKDIMISEKKNLINNLKKYQKKHFPLVIQRYITNPLLLNGHKFDFRIFVLYIDNKVYVCTKYYHIRIAVYKYKLDENIYHGITTLSKDGSNMILDKNDFLKEYKIEYPTDNMNFLNGKLEKKIFNIVRCIFNYLKKNIKMKFWNDKQNHYFNLFGFDIMSDNKGKLWFLEINNNPYLRKSRKHDLLIEDMINIIMKKKQSSFIEVL